MLHSSLVKRLANSPAIYLVGLDKEANYTYINNRFASRLSYISTNLIGKSISITNRPEDLEKMLQVLANCSKNPGTTHTLLVKKEDENGEWFWTYWEVASVEEPCEDGTEYFGIGYDVTESERAHLQSKLYARQIDSLIDNIPNAFILLSPRLTLSKVNRAAEVLLKGTRDSFLGKPLWEFFKKEEKSTFYQAILEVRDRKLPLRMEEYLPWQKGWFDIAAYPADGEGVTLIIIDITDKKLNEDHIRESKNKLKAIMDSTSDFNMLLDPAMRILSYNKAAAQTTRQLYNRELVEGQSVLEYILPDTIEEFKQYFTLALNGETQQVKVKLNFKDDFVLWYQVKYYPVYGADSRLIGVAFNSTNIDKLQRQYERLSEIARLYSHEIRRPVATILGITQLIDENQLSKENKDWLEYLKTTTKQLDEVIHSIVEKTVEVESNAE